MVDKRPVEALAEVSMKRTEPQRSEASFSVNPEIDKKKKNSVSGAFESGLSQNEWASLGFSNEDFRGL